MTMPNRDSNIQLRLLFACTFLVIVVFQIKPAAACLAHYRSPDFLVADSPLIFIGTVENVHEIPRDKKHKGLGFPTDASEAGPSQAIVRIGKMLKGSYDQATVKVVSGPLSSCAPYPVHYTFTKGWQGVFILTDYPNDGRSALLYGGCLLSLKDIPVVENRLARARDFKARYVAELAKESPKVLAAGKALADKLQSECSKWPVRTLNQYAMLEEDEVFKAALKNFVAKLSEIDIAVIQAAMAFDWPCDRPDCWSKHELFTRVIYEMCPKRKVAIKKFARARVRKQLARAGIEKKYADRFLENLADSDLSREVHFPDVPPYAYRKKIDPSDLTTEFILRYHAYDRGSMFTAYGMDFDRLSKLDAKRAKAEVAAMLGSDDQRLQTVAFRVIERVPGTEFVDLIVDELLYGKPGNWGALIMKKKPKQTDRRLKAMIKIAKEKFTGWGFMHFWSVLVRGECFKQVVVDEAIKLLAEAEKAAEDDKQAKALAGSLHDYLNAAMQHRRAKEVKQLSVKEYKGFFKKNPEKK
jgi:hypothetical protein